MPRILVLALLLNQIAAFSAQTPAPLGVEEATIAEIHATLQAKRTTCRSLVAQYLRRIEAYDKNGPALNGRRRTRAAPGRPGPSRPGVCQWPRTS